jgi:hypothetical protein
MRDRQTVVLSLPTDVQDARIAGKVPPLALHTTSVAAGPFWMLPAFGWQAAHGAGLPTSLAAWIAIGFVAIFFGARSACVGARCSVDNSPAASFTCRRCSAPRAIVPRRATRPTGRAKLVLASS